MVIKSNNIKVKLLLDALVLLHSIKICNARKQTQKKGLIIKWIQWKIQSNQKVETKG